MSPHTRSLKKNRFIEMLRACMDKNPSPSDLRNLEAAYERYIGCLQRMVVHTAHYGVLEALHTLARTKQRLMLLKCKASQPPRTVAALLDAAVELTDFEIRLLCLRLQYPAVMEPDDSPAQAKSPLHLSREYTPTDIMELITALHLSGAIRYIDGKPAEMAVLVNIFSWAFNLRIKHPDQCRHAVVNRKLRLTRFLDILRNNLVEYSQR